MTAALPGEESIDTASTGEDKEVKTPAVQRLAESRERLRQWMTQGDSRHEARRRTAAAQARGEKSPIGDRLRSIPVLGLVIDGVSAWWSHHPLHSAAALANGMARKAVVPSVRRHPIAVVAAAFLIGAAAVRFKPWRMLLKPALFGGLSSHLLSSVMSQVPFESLMGRFGSVAQTDLDDSSDMAHEPDAAADAAAQAARQPDMATS